MNSISSGHVQRGMTLLEVLVAILIFSLGLVGLVALQGRALQYSTSAEDTNRAALFASEMASTMLLLQKVDPATSTELAARVTAWQTRIADPTKGGLPNGTVSVTADSGLATITIQWRATTAASGAANATNQYVTQFKLVN